MRTDITKWPFIAASIWNTPIGDGAVYTQFRATKDANGGEQTEYGINQNGIRVGNDGNPDGWNRLNLGIDRNYIAFTTEADPLRNVYYQHSWGPGRGDGTDLVPKYPGGPTPYQIHLPDSLVIPDVTSGSTPNDSAAIVQPDGTIEHFNVACRPVAGQDNFHATVLSQFCPESAATVAADASAYSTGVLGGHGGSSMSAWGGALMPGDLVGSDPIHHALSLDINGSEYLYYDAATGGHVWPAVTQDGGATAADYWSGYHGHYPALRLGSLLAIPPNTFLALTHPAAIKIFEALKYYGAYVVDNTGWSSVDINACPEADAECVQNYGHGIAAGEPNMPWPVFQPFYDELVLVYSNLQVVSNNSPTSVGGGGNPRVQPAPPLWRSVG